MMGFWDDPVSSAERIVDGWVLTGDIGRLDEQGFLYVLDRKDDMIISGGTNIWPLELENAILENSAVVEVAVFGIPDEKWGERPAAVCVVAPGADITEQDIIEICSRSLGSYKKPAWVSITTEPLPKTPAGKIQRRFLSEPYWVGRERRVAGG
jgi:acyl-CoA synthetase (AMP-forming)/AMP-acid ligase II